MHDDVLAVLQEELAYQVARNGFECVDNHRYAKCTDFDAMQQYKRQQDSGCCGSYDVLFRLVGETYTIGCNYGH